MNIERSELVDIVKEAIAESKCFNCDLSIDVIRDIVSDQMTESLGENHRAHHDAIAEFTATWADVRKVTRNYFLIAILSLITTALVAGFVLLIRNYSLH